MACGVGLPELLLTKTLLKTENINPNTQQLLGLRLINPIFFLVVLGVFLFLLTQFFSDTEIRCLSFTWPEGTSIRFMHIITCFVISGL